MSQTGAFRVDPYIRAAATLQSLGKDKAIDTLLKLAENREQDSQVIVLCRMLFVKKAKGEFRRPYIGAALSSAALPTQTGPWSRSSWLMEYHS